MHARPGRSLVAFNMAEALEGEAKQRQISGLKKGDVSPVATVSEQGRAMKIALRFWL